MQRSIDHIVAEAGLYCKSKALHPMNGAMPFVDCSVYACAVHAMLGMTR